MSIRIGISKRIGKSQSIQSSVCYHVDGRWYGPPPCECWPTAPACSLAPRDAKPRTPQRSSPLQYPDTSQPARPLSQRHSFVGETQSVPDDRQPAEPSLRRRHAGVVRTAEPPQPCAPRPLFLPLGESSRIFCCRGSFGRPRRFPRKCGWARLVFNTLRPAF
jgi:hypothetical protein